nr:DNA polymerase III subunit delta' [Thauera sp.]
AERGEGEGGDAAGGREGGGKAASAQIVIEQIRDLQAALSVTGHHGARRVVVLDPAEAMNPFTANALLKLLEEPPAGCVFLLVSSAPRRLLPTIRSRCQQWLFARPEEHALAHWKTRADPDVLALLALGGGMPLAAERLARAGGGALLARFVRDLAGLQASDALKLAAQWESWLKSREALAAGFGLPELCDWMQRWVSDLASVRLGGRVRFFPAQQAVLSTLASRCSVAAASACYNEMAQIRRVSRHPLSLRLVLEDLLMRYVRATAGVRG